MNNCAYFLSLIILLLPLSGCFAENDEEATEFTQEFSGIYDIDSLVLECRNTIISNGSNEDFDANFREIGNMVVDDSESQSKYKIYYSAYPDNASVTNDGIQTYIGYSYSDDGKNWIKHPNSIISRPLEDPYVVFHDGIYHLFAEDKFDVPFRNIRKYSSFDGANWSDDGDIFDVIPGGEPIGWESQDVSSPIVWIEDQDWYMLYEGRGNGGGKIGLARSIDGFNWTRESPIPVFGNGTPGSWDDLQVVPDDLLIIQDEYYMIYHGYSNLTAPYWMVGIAVSKDLHTWDRILERPLAEVNTLMVTKTDNFHFHFTGDKNQLSPTEDISGICAFEIEKL
jgi:hypothetical protein